MKQLYILLFSFFACSTYAQNTHSFGVINTSNSGIPSNNVNDIALSSGGTLWITTNNGLSAMIGSTFLNYNTTNSTIQTNLLNKVILGNNKVWITTYGEGLIVRSGTTFTQYTTSNSGLPSNDIRDIAMDGLNNLWLATAAGLAKFNGTTWTTFNAANSNIISNDVTSVGIDNMNTVWISSGFVLRKFNGTTFTYINDGIEKILKIVNDTIYVDIFDGYAKYVNGVQTESNYMNNSCLADCAIQALEVDENNNPWLGLLQQCHTGGIQNWNDCSVYFSQNSPITDNNITSLIVNNSGSIWFGTQEGGLVRMNLTDTPAVPMTPAPDPTLPQSQVVSLFSNVYTNVPVNTWDADWADAHLSEIQIAGNDTKKYTNCNYAALETYSPDFQIDARNLSYFHIDVWSPDFAIFEIKLVDLGADGMFGDDDVEHEITFSAPAQSEWISYHIPLSDFTNLTTKAHLGRFTFASNYAHVFIDNVYFSTAALGTVQNNIATIGMYPNPANSIVNFSSTENIEEISVVSMLGQQIMTVQPNATSSKLDVSAFDKGVYMANIIINGKTTSKKLVVK